MIIQRNHEKTYHMTRGIPVDEEDVVTRNIRERVVLNNVTNFLQKSREPLKGTVNLRNNSIHNLEDQKVGKERPENSEVKDAQQDNKTDDIAIIAVRNLVKRILSKKV